MSKKLECKLTRKQNNIAYGIYRNVHNGSFIHNLSKVKIIPFYVQFVLALGLNFIPSTKPSFKLFSHKMRENLRRLAWNIHFKIIGKEKELTNLDRFLIKCKKRSFMSRKPPKIFDILFPDSDMVKDMYKNICNNYTKCIFPPVQLIEKCKYFLKTNNLIVKNADKNAGICIMDLDWHDDEIYKQLDDENTYIPSCKALYDMKTDLFIDKVKAMKLKICNDVYLDRLIYYSHKPASFYILPKVHKTFTYFPPGRPISSTCNSINRNISAYVDYLLKPVMCTLPSILLDTTHFLILLNEISLEDNRKYVLVTYDVDSMYTNLNVNNCKKFCTKAYGDYIVKNKSDEQVSTVDMAKLLHLSLDYSMLQFRNMHYIQRRGIQMGNSASVTIANITAFHELKNIFTHKEIVFNVRFVDDGFLIVDCTDLQNVKNWLDNVFRHDYLTFTVAHSLDSVNFLDVQVSLINNKINTALYKKPMSKNLYLSYYSNHPKHLLQALPYSQGIRIRRI